MKSSSQAVLIYDGRCGLCSKSVRWLVTHWRDASTQSVMAAHDVTDAQLVAWSLSRSELEVAAWWVEDGEVLGAHRAIARALGRCRGVYGFIGRTAAGAPLRWVGAIIYPIVARNRHRLSFGAERCPVDSSSLAR